MFEWIGFMYQGDICWVRIHVSGDCFTLKMNGKKEEACI